MTEGRAKLGGDVQITSVLVKLRDGSEHSADNGTDFLFTSSGYRHPLSPLDLLVSDYKRRGISPIEAAGDQVKARAAKFGTATATVVWSSAVEDIAYLAKRDGTVANVINHTAVSHISITYELIVRRELDS